MTRYIITVFFGCFDTRLCKLVSLFPYDIVVNLIRFSRFLFQEMEGKTSMSGESKGLYLLTPSSTEDSTIAVHESS